MSYLKKVTLNNFQSHINSVVEFDKSLNIIVGPSDSGKTAIIRGIKWALYNEPSGDFFIREGTTEASVTLEFSNNIKIKRLRSKSKNAYILYNRDEDEIIFEGFGNRVPQEIIDLVGIKKIPLDTNETNAINLGEQLEGAFLLSEKGSTRASAIGRLIGVNLIDDALKDTIKDNRNISIEKRTIGNNIKTIEEELTTYEYLDDLIEKIIKLELIRDGIKTKDQLKEKLKLSLNDYKNIKTEKDNINKILLQLREVSTLENNIYNLEKSIIILSSYNNLQKRIVENKKLINYNNDIRIKLTNNDDLEDIITNIEALKNKWMKLNKNMKQLDKYNIEIKTTTTIHNALKDLSLIDSNAYNINTKINTLNHLKIINKKLKSVYDSIKVGNNYLEKLNQIDKIDVFTIKLSENISKIKEVSKSNNKLKSNKSEITLQENKLNEIKANMNNNLKLYEELLLKSEVCPFCFSHINEDKIEHIMDHYS